MGWRLATVAIALLGAAQSGTTASECATCHPREARDHARTRMAHAMVPALISAFAQNLPAQPLRESEDGFRFAYRLTDKGISVTASRGNDHAEGLIEWMVGSGEQGQTPLVQLRAGIAQHRVSYFPQLHRYGITIGDDPGTSASAEAALGRKWNTHDLAECLNCHATSVSSDLARFVPGVQCVRCHPGATEHAQGHGMPLNPGKLDAGSQVTFCGACHRLKPPGTDADIENIRFQPLRLMKSKCFGSGKLSCTSCHTAHQDVHRNDAAYYSEKCLVCHAKQAHLDDNRQKAACVSCHMPAVQLHPALRFTDHYIRVVTVSRN